MFLEHVGNEWNHVCPFKFATAAVCIFVGVREFLGGAPVKRRFRKTKRNVLGQAQIQTVYVHVLAEVFLFEKLHGVLRVYNRAQFKLVAKIRRRCRLKDAASAVLPRAVIALFSAQNHMVAPSGAHTQVVESGKEFDGIQVVACTCRENVPGALVVALLVVGNAFARIVEMVVNVLVGVVGAHLDSGVEQEPFGKVSIQE